MPYTIQQRIHILSHNAVMDADRRGYFRTLDIDFSHWKFNWAEGWAHNYWLAEARIDASNYREAADIFNSKLWRVVPRVALIGQCYAQSGGEPALIHKDQSHFAYFRYARETKGVPLMFREQQVDALGKLLQTPNIPDEFYLYWNDAVNTIGYSAKLLMMFAALEALFRDERKKGKESYYAKIETIFGQALKAELYGTKEDPSTGLRQRLVHGEYIKRPDTEKNYIEIVHKCVIAYFNDHILGGKFIAEHVVNPQRHLFGNIEGWNGFVKAKNNAPMRLKELLEDFTKHDAFYADNYEFVSVTDYPDLLSNY